MVTGHCHCGAVRYEFEGEPNSAGYCHCSQCRRLTGSAFAPWCEVPSANLRWSHDDNLQKYNITERYVAWFCGACGAPLATTHSKEPGATSLLMGTLEDDSGIAPQYHIYTGSKAPWYEIRDSLPQYERGRKDA
ncbi:MAG TPA: GFA family protein [Woeseiaceae bacterium]|nr:GFA family protein [Woeseiaceae bacterium]